MCTCMRRDWQNLDKPVQEQKSQRPKTTKDWALVSEMISQTTSLVFVIMLEAASGEVCIVFLLRTTSLFPQEEK